MTYYLIIAALVLITICVKKILDLNSLVTIIRKDPKVRDIKNPLEKKYEFIKGLY
jgi:hypothetical protein